MRPTAFEIDPFPGKPRILFVGLAESTHTHSWIDLLRDREFNVRLFALPTPGGFPPDAWPVRTYISGPIARRFDPALRRTLHGPLGRIPFLRKPYRLGWHALRRLRSPERWLTEIVNDWRPDVIHTLGLDPAGLFFDAIRRHGALTQGYQWVLQLRGGSDLALTQYDPARRPVLAEALQACDQLLSDNRENFRIGQEMGLREAQIAPIAPVPGTGGVDVDGLRAGWQGAPSARRVILWPKAYDCPWSLGLPVLEALRLCWDEIQPCEIHLLVADESIRMWYRSLPETMRAHMHLAPRIPRQQVLELLAQARVVLLPSLIDGTPNSMFEAMACGALPIVSPLDTIRPVVEDGKHVLFARNLYPAEIATALRWAMTDDDFIDHAARANLERVREIADRATIAPRVAAFYTGLCQRSGTPSLDQELAVRILIVGGTGMLGHRLWMELSRTHETWATLRGGVGALPDLPYIDRARVVEGVDALHLESVIQAFAEVRPDVAINCVGLIKQQKRAKEALPSIDLNARFPHQLAAVCAASGSRLIHISTDCVFAGTKGMYTEADPVDAQDVYGRSKALGEVALAEQALTIRTSIIGRELASHHGLLEWFLSQPGPVKGFKKAIFSGFTTSVVADILRDVILPRPELHGLYHVSAAPINKYDLLSMVNEAFGRQTEILPDEAFAIDRSLDSTRFRTETGYVPPAWPDMVAVLASDPLPYGEWKA